MDNNRLEELKELLLNYPNLTDTQSERLAEMLDEKMNYED